VSDAPRVQVLFGHQKQWSPPLGSGLPKALKFSVTRQSTLLHSLNGFEKIGEVFMKKSGLHVLHCYF
jgi:hypothetical protein